MGRPRPKVSKSTLRGQPLAVKAIQRAKLQEQMDPDELQARMMFQLPLDLTDSDILKVITERMGSLDFTEVAQDLFGHGKNTKEADMDYFQEHSEAYVEELQRVARDVMTGEGYTEDPDLDEETNSMIKARLRALRYRFYHILEHGGYTNKNGELVMMGGGSISEDEEGKPRRAEVPVKRSEVKRVEQRPRRKYNEDDEVRNQEDDDEDDDEDEYEDYDCDDCCSNPECENYTVEAVRGLHVPTYSLLLETGRHHPDVYKTRATIEDENESNKFTSSRNRPKSFQHVNFMFLEDNLAYGTMGNNLPIFRTVEGFKRGNTPRFVKEFDQAMTQFTGFKLDLANAKGSRTVMPDPMRALGALHQDRSSGSNRQPVNCDEIESPSPSSFHMALVPANHGDYVLSIPALDFVKPIIQDGFVRVNGHKVPARLMTSGTEYMPSFVQAFGRIVGNPFERRNTPDNWKPPPKEKETLRTPSSLPGDSQEAQERMIAALRGSLALELQDGFLKGRVSKLQSMIQEGNRIIQAQTTTT